MEAGREASTGKRPVIPSTEELCPSKYRMRREEWRRRLERLVKQIRLEYGSEIDELIDPSLGEVGATQEQEQQEQRTVAVLCLVKGDLPRGKSNSVVASSQTIGRSEVGSALDSPPHHPMDGLVDPNSQQGRSETFWEEQDHQPDPVDDFKRVCSRYFYETGTEVQSQ